MDNMSDVTRCHMQHEGDKEAFLQCLCRHVGVRFCDSSTTTTQLPSAATDAAAFDWSRSYSVSAGLCILFLAMCAVIIVLRVFRQRDDPQPARVARVVPPVDPNPPPYEVVVQSPPSYCSLQPPAYGQLDTAKCAQAAAGGSGSGAAGSPSSDA